MNIVRRIYELLSRLASRSDFSITSVALNGVPFPKKVKLSRHAIVVNFGCGRAEYANFLYRVALSAGTPILISIYYHNKGVVLCFRMLSDLSMSR